MRPMDLEAEVAAVRRGGRRAALVEESPRRLFVHRVRTLHGGVPGEHHRQAAQPAQDRHQHAPATDGERSGRDGRLDGVQGPALAHETAAVASTEPENRAAIASSTTTSPKKSSGRARAAARACRSARCRSTSSSIINELRRNLVLVGVAFPGGDSAGVRIARAQRLAVGVQPRRPRRVGAWDWTSARWPRWRSTASGPTCSSGSAAWDRSTTAPRRSPSRSRESSRRATSASRSSARRSTATATRRAAWATSTSIRCWPRTRSRRSTDIECRPIVTSCPHCFHQIGNEFPQLGGNYEVIHHSTYIERLLSEDRVPLRDRERQTAHRRVPRFLLPRPLQRRLRRAA